MYQVEELLKLAGGKYSIKLWNIFLKDHGQVFCDAYLAEINKNWTILLNGNGNKILLSKAQIEYLISKMERLDLLRYDRGEMEEYFGLVNGSGIKKDGQYYKLLFQYQTHWKGEKKRYPCTLFIKEYSNPYRVDFDKLLLDLYKFKSILEKMIIGKGMIKVESIYDIEHEKQIYERESYTTSNDSQRGSNNSKSASTSTEQIISERDKKIIELGEAKVTIGKNKGRRLKELPQKDVEWLAIKCFDRDLRKTATEYLTMMF